MDNAPSRLASAALSVVVGSPVAANPAAMCELSQYGLFLDSPQRQSVARVPIGAPATTISALIASGPFSRTKIVLTIGLISLAPPSWRETRIAPDGQFKATYMSASALAASGSIQGPSTFALNTVGCESTHRRA